MNKKILKNIEWGILVCTILLMAIGLVALFSSTQNSDYDEFKKQVMWLGISIPIIIIVICIDYEFLAKISPVIYGISLLMLIGVLFTEPINGATSWFSIGPFTLQPSEFAKIAIVLFLASVLVKLQAKGREEINRIWKLGIAIFTVAVPVLFIIKQPDYGTALAFLSALIFILFTGGIKKRYIIISALIVIIMIPVAYFFILPEHAKTRIDVYLNPDLDPRGSRIQYYSIKTSNWFRRSFRNGII